MGIGVFTENFIRIDTNDGVAGVMIIRKRKGDTIDFNDRMNEIKIMDKKEAEEMIKLIQEGISKL